MGLLRRLRLPRRPWSILHLRRKEMMRSSSIGDRLRMLTIFAALMGASSSLAHAQAPQSALPANWQQLAPADFAQLVRPYLDQGTIKSLSPPDQFSLARQGAQLFSQVDFGNTTLGYATIDTLELAGESQLDQRVLAGAKNALLARQDSWSGKPYSEMRAKVMLMMRLDVPDPVWNLEARRWVLAGGTSDQVPPNDLALDFVRQMFADFKVIDRSFSVTWTGQITAPQTGDYTFYITPIDVNMGFTSPSVSVSTKVLLGGQSIITATPPSVPSPPPVPSPSLPVPRSNWVSKSGPVALTAGTPVSIQVLVSVSAPQRIPASLLHAVLFWQGPGINRSLVPASTFSQAQTGAPGLQATYTWIAAGQQQSLSRVDPMIDFAWSDSSLLLAPDPTSANQSANAMWQAMTAPTFISAYASATPPVQLHPFLNDPGEVSCGLSTVQRQAFLDLLLQNPTLLDAMNAAHAVSFFKSFRVGTPEKALTVFGTWADRQPDLPPELATGRSFDRETRTWLGQMAILVTQQLTSQANRLQQEFLQLADGRCSLPVAYTLTYSYLGQGKLSNWIATLDAKLADPTVTGDLRVNWLIARAQAEEFAQTGQQQYPFGSSHPTSSPKNARPFLFQALNTAQNPWIKVRVAKEVAGRLISSSDFQSANEFLGQVATSLPANQKAVVNGMQQQINGFVTVNASSIQTQQSDATTAYLRTLHARRDRAASQGDSASVSRYDALISAASNRQ
jgi:hypothetical protein